MTNNEIIFRESIRLLEAGRIKGTGRTYTYTTETGESITIEEPEQLHTYAAWKQLGRQVRRGEHGFEIHIWKHCTQKGDTPENEEGTKSRMIWKKAFFFTMGQTEPATKKGKKTA